MEKNFMQAAMKVAVYTHKQGTGTRFVFQSGCSLLPETLSISNFLMDATKRKGREIARTGVGQIMGDFKKSETSPLKRFRTKSGRFTCRTRIYGHDDFPLLFGWGNVGVPNEEGEIKDTGNLVVLYTPDEWKTMMIYIFLGVGEKPDVVDGVMAYVNELIR